ncbi:MAG: hypothetical protein ISS79_02495 [Phycisphaerae bacterium]|nr:hypothetical protein [Phycisphaerae bacterium]
MGNQTKERFLSELTDRYGSMRKVSTSQSLFDLIGGKARIYVRYSKKHGRKQAFYGLRQIDLKRLEGHAALLCFLWEGQKDPLLIPFSEYEEVFRSAEPAADGQYKVQVYEQNDMTELYIAKAGRFNVESYFGWSQLETLIDASQQTIPILSHAQVQTLLGAIGAAKGYRIWLPLSDRRNVDLSLAKNLPLSSTLPLQLRSINKIIEGIDVIWIHQATGAPKAFFEVEHSTPIYSALLRFNDVHILAPQLKAGFSVVSNDSRRSLFVRQLNRPTFQASTLTTVCNFLEYRNVFLWHNKLVS